MTGFSRLAVGLMVLVSCTGSARAQFLETFDDQELQLDPAGIDGWSFSTGDGQATMAFVAGGEGHASILVDATRDRRNVWWALIKRRVSEGMDLERLSRPGWELRVEARIRSSAAPRRVNLHVNTQRTTDFHSHLMEFDIPDTGVWHTITMTTRDFPVEPGDVVFAQMALMDWGLGTYEVDVDSFRVDVVEAATAPPDLGAPVPYHPPVPDPGSFHYSVPATESAVIDLANPGVNLGNWSEAAGSARVPLLTVGGPLRVVLRFDLGALEGRRVAGHGLLELTTGSVLRTSDAVEDFGLVRVVEILGGEAGWKAGTVTADSLLGGRPLDRVFNPQMIIDWPVTEDPGGKTLFTVSRPVLQRLVDGTTGGLALTPLGSIVASFATRGTDAPRLLFNLEDRPGGE